MISLEARKRHNERKGHKMIQILFLLALKTFCFIFENGKITSLK